MNYNNLKKISNLSAEEYQIYIFYISSQDLTIFYISSQDLTRSDFDTFMTKCKDAVDIRVPIKREYLRSKQNPFINKNISKATMYRTRLGNGILQHLVDFIRNIYAKFSIPNSLQSPDIGQNSDVGISDFRISDQSLIKENYHNSRTSDDTDMKLGAVTKIDKRNKTTSKNLTMRSCRQTVTSL